MEFNYKDKKFRKKMTQDKKNQLKATTKNEIANKEYLEKKRKEMYKDCAKAIEYAQRLWLKYKKAHPEMDEKILRAKLSKRIIRSYAFKAANLSIIMCLTSAIPTFLGTFISSVGGAAVEKFFVLDKLNKHLMVSLAIVNNYECDEFDYKNIESSSYFQLAGVGVVVNFCMRLADIFPGFGQLVVLIAGIPLCFFINQFIVSKFGEMVLNEFNLELD